MNPVPPKTFNNTNPHKYYLTQEEKYFYSENGYLVIKNLFDIETLDSFRERFYQMLTDKALKNTCSVIVDRKLKSSNDEPENYVNKIQDILWDPVFARYSESPRLLHVARQCVGADLAALNCMLINKPPGSLPHPPHQDSFYIPMHPIEHSMVGSWTAMDFSTIDNGCLFCIPGSHKLGLLQHQPFQESKKFFHSIANEAAHAPAQKRIHLEMESGDTVLLHPFLVHGSGPNITNSCRKAMTVHYIRTDSEYVDLRGTWRDWLVRDFEENVFKNKQPGGLEYVDVWKMKTKVIPSQRSHL